MNMDLFSVFDSVAQRYLKPFFAENVASAIRAFGDVAVDPEHMFGQHPEDYALYHVGSWEGESGTLITMEPHKIASANSFIAAAGPQLEVDRVAQEGRA